MDVVAAAVDVFFSTISLRRVVDGLVKENTAKKGRPDIQKDYISERIVELMGVASSASR